MEIIIYGWNFSKIENRTIGLTLFNLMFSIYMNYIKFNYYNPCPHWRQNITFSMYSDCTRVTVIECYLKMDCVYNLRLFTNIPRKCPENNDKQIGKNRKLLIIFLIFI